MQLQHPTILTSVNIGKIAGQGQGIGPWTSFNLKVQFLPRVWFVC